METYLLRLSFTEGISLKLKRVDSSKNMLMLTLANPIVKFNVQIKGFMHE